MRLQTKYPNILIHVLVPFLTCAAASGAGLEKDYPIRPVPFTQVHIHDSFWADRIETNRSVSIPYAFGQCEIHGRMDNFDIAGGVLDASHRGEFPFDDTDAYKILEGASYGLAVKDDPELGAYLDGVIAKIARAQEDDGYLFTTRTNQYEHLRGWMGPERWSNLRSSHELYNAGHLYEAAAAHYQATGKRNLLDIALKNAALLLDTFGPDRLRIPPGHQIIEMGLAKLYRVTGDRRYLDLAQFYLDLRGNPAGGRELWGSYSQDHSPLLEQDEAVGHAVRAVYMYSGAADVAALTGNAEYIEAIGRIWDNVVSKKLYVTGGVGATGNGEAFGENYELPNMSAYCETCAAIGNVYWNHRMFLLRGEAKYIDVMERTLYNGLLSGVSLGGGRFFYPNPLESHGQHERSPWFDCACCPGNITRFIASVPGYQYAVKDGAIYVNLFAQGTAEMTAGGGRVTVEQRTDYPWDGKVGITVRPDGPRELALMIRVPGWARNEPVPSDLYRFMREDDSGYIIEVNGEPIEPELMNGYAVIQREWKPGDTVEADFPMPVRRVLAHGAVEANRGKTALQRGPLVYCAEWPDNGGHVLNLLLDDTAVLKAEYRGDLFDGASVIRGKARALKYGEDGKTVESNAADFTAIPYYAWAHRGRGEMAVWIAREEAAARPLPFPTLATESAVSVSGGENPGAVNDGLDPSGPDVGEIPFFHWWPKKGATEWVQYDFGRECEISSVEVYWFDDTGRGECRAPKSWRVLYEAGGEWVPVRTDDEYGVAENAYNPVVFEPVKTRALRLEVALQDRWSAGLYEWRVK